MRVVDRGMMIDKAELAAEIASSAAIGEAVQAFQRCPKCGADHFTQRPIR